MKRRSFLTHSGMAGILAAGTAPAFAQAAPAVKWRCASSFPKSLDTIYGAAETAAKVVSDITGGKFQIQVFAAGEIVPGLQVADAVQNGTVECGHTAPYYYVGKDPSFAFGTAIPFGLNQRQYDAWWFFGGGEQLFNEFLKSYNITSILCGNTGAQMGGWYRKEIKTVAGSQGSQDAYRRLRGPGADQARRRAAADRGRRHLSVAREGHDRRRGMGRPLRRREARLQQGREVLLLPGLVGRRPGAAHVHQHAKYNELSAENKAALRAGCAEGNTWMMAKYDAQNPGALRKLVAGGTQLRPFSKAIMDACYGAAMELYAETSAKNANFKKLWDNLSAFQKDQILWFRVTENTYDNYMAQVGQAAAPAKKS
jgi:TRAP-type mannitol/chloroaromatic compound transport system substrate-binding protein